MKIINLLIFFLIFNISFSLSIFPKELKKNASEELSETFIISSNSNENYIVKVKSIFNDSNVVYKIHPQIFILNSNSQKIIKIALNHNLKNQFYKGKIKFELIPFNLKEFNNIVFELHLNAEIYTNNLSTL